MESVSIFRFLLAAKWINLRSAAFPIMLLLTIALAACSSSTPPGSNSIWGTSDHTNYLLLDWPEGLRILIWDNIFEGEHHNHTESATYDPVFFQSGRAQSIDGRSYEYSLETRDGLQADFAVDGDPYDLDQGKLFLIRTDGGTTQVEQIDLDLSKISPTNAGIEEFGQQMPQIAAFIQGSISEFTNENCHGLPSESKPPADTSFPTDPLPLSLKGYVIQSYCWEGEWYFTLTPGLNAVEPCDTPGSTTAADFPSTTVKGVGAMKAVLEELKPGEHVILCSPHQVDADVIEEILAYSERLGIYLSTLPELKPSPTLTAPAAVSPDPAPTIDTERNIDSAITVSAVTPDNALWYAFDVFDEGGGVSPYDQNQGLYKKKDGMITHFDFPAAIRVVEVGPEGGLYVGAGCGVVRYRDESWETLLEIDCSHRSSVAGLVPIDITFTEDGTVWVGGAHSLASYDGNSWSEFDIPAVRVAAAADGTIWTRGWDGRANSDCCITHIAGHQWITYTLSADIPAEPELLRTLFDQPDR